MDTKVSWRQGCRWCNSSANRVHGTETETGPTGTERVQWDMFAKRPRVPGTQTGSDEESEVSEELQPVPNQGYASMDEGWGGGASDSEYSEDENRPIQPKKVKRMETVVEKPEVEKPAVAVAARHPYRGGGGGHPYGGPVIVDTMNVTWSGGVKFAATSVVLTILWALFTRRQN